MDESAMKGLKLNGGDLETMSSRRSRSVRMLVKGYDTSLHVDCVKSALSEHFSVCGEIVCVSISYDVEDGTPNRTADIYIMGEDAEEKALQLSGSEMGGRKLVVTPPPKNFVKLSPQMAARLARADLVFSSKMIHVTGYDTSLPADDIKSALTNHFSSCGEIVDFDLFHEKNTCPIRAHSTHAPICAPTTNQALISILGEGAEEKALQLNGSDMGGRKLVVVPAYIPSKDRRRTDFRYGYSIPVRCANPKKKTDRNRKKSKK